MAETETVAKHCPTCNLEFDHLVANYGIFDLINEFTSSIQNLSPAIDLNFNVSVHDKVCLLTNI